MMLTLALAVAAQAAAQPAPAEVQQAGTPAFEVQCMVALNQAAAQATEEQPKAQLATMALFYSARVDILQQNDAQLTQAVQQQVDGMAGKALGAVAQSCAQHMQQRMGRFSRLAQQAESTGQ